MKTRQSNKKNQNELNAAQANYVNALDHLSNVEMSQSQSALNSKSIPSCQSLNQAAAPKKSKKRTTEVACSGLSVTSCGSAPTSSDSASTSCGLAAKSSSSASARTDSATTINRTSIMKSMLTAMKQSLNIF